MTDSQYVKRAKLPTIYDYQLSDLEEAGKTLIELASLAKLAGFDSLHKRGERAAHTVCSAHHEAQQVQNACKDAKSPED